MTFKNNTNKTKKEKRNTWRYTSKPDKRQRRQVQGELQNTAGRKQEQLSKGSDTRARLGGMRRACPRPRSRSSGRWGVSPFICKKRDVCQARVLGTSTLVRRHFFPDRSRNPIRSQSKARQDFFRETDTLILQFRRRHRRWHSQSAESESWDRVASRTLSRSRSRPAPRQTHRTTEQHGRRAAAASAKTIAYQNGLLVF